MKCFCRLKTTVLTNKVEEIKWVAIYKHQKLEKMHRKGEGAQRKLGDPELETFVTRGVEEKDEPANV